METESGNELVSIPVALVRVEDDSMPVVTVLLSEITSEDVTTPEVEALTTSEEYRLVWLDVDSSVTLDCGLVCVEN